MASDFRGKTKHVYVMENVMIREFQAKYEEISASSDKVPTATQIYPTVTMNRYDVLIYYEMNANTVQETKVQETVKQEEAKMRLKL